MQLFTAKMKNPLNDVEVGQRVQTWDGPKEKAK